MRIKMDNLTSMIEFANHVKKENHMQQQEIHQFLEQYFQANECELFKMNLDLLKSN